MADNKKYYYLKLKDNFYDSEQMIILQNMQDGYLYSDILMKLYLRSLKTEGKLMFNNLIPYTPSVLAQVVRHQIGTVERSLKIFRELGLIEVLENGAIYMLDIQNFIGKSSTDGDRKRAYRTKINKEKLMIGQMSDKRPPEIEIEIDIEKEIDKELELDENIFEFLETNFGRTISPIEYEKLLDWEDEFTNDIIQYAIELSCLNNAKTLNYVVAILQDWKSKGFTKLTEIKDKETKKTTETPNWFNKENEIEELSEGEKEEMKKLLEEFR